jgi:hypothetical protein
MSIYWLPAEQHGSWSRSSMGGLAMSISCSSFIGMLWQVLSMQILCLLRCVSEQRQRRVKMLLSLSIDGVLFGQGCLSKGQLMLMILP